jgi:hypothetical protein
MALPTNAESALFAADYVTHVLTYWFYKANKASSPTLSEIDTLLKERGVTASALLGAVGEILTAFAQDAPRLREGAWHLSAMQRRAGAFALFLLCCRMAALRKIRFDPTHCGPVFRALLELFERLRPVALPVGSSTAVGQLAYLAALALPLRRIPYGATVLDEALEWLSVYQFEPGISPDGVWREGFAQHGAVFTTLFVLTTDLRQAGVSVRPLAGAMAKLARFAEIFLAEDGACPPIDELPAAAYPRLQRDARAFLQTSATAANLVKQTAPRDAAVFPDSGYFISRSSKQDRRLSSHLVVHARPAPEGGPSLTFSVGGKNLLIGGGTMDRRASVEIRRTSRTDPAAHNAIRVNGHPGAGARKRDPQAVRIEASWEQPSWAAVQLVNEAFDPARLVRTVIHLKARQALIVVDEVAADREARFEQFWHFAPELQPPAPGAPLSFAASSQGVLNVAFDPGGTTRLAADGGPDAIGWTSPRTGEVTPNPYIVRERQAAHALMASFFQWSSAARVFAVAAEGARDSWTVTVSVAGAAVRFSLANGKLRLVE